MSRGMTATKLRLILMVSILMIIVAATGGFLYVRHNLIQYADTISRLNADAAAGDQNLQTLSSLQAKLNERQAAIDAAHALVADNATYSDVIINDITRIANESGVRLTGIDFLEVAAGTAATTTTPAAGVTPTAPVAPSAAPAGVVKKTITVSIDTPLEYSSLMKFISGLEMNDLKMQLPSVSITKAEKSKVSTQQFTIEVYVRQ